MNTLPNIILTLAMFLTNWSALSAPTDQKRTYDLLRKLNEASKQNIAKNVGCDSFEIPSARKMSLTIGDFIAWNISLFEKQQKTSYVRAECNKRSAKIESCDVSFITDDSSGESPWSCGLRFDVSIGSNKIIPSSILCIGSC